MPIAHTQFIIDGTTYMLRSDCPQEIWPRLCDRVQKELMRIGKASAAAMVGQTGTVKSTTLIMQRNVGYILTINPKGIIP